MTRRNARDNILATLTATLKGISQVLLIENAITGLIVLIGLALYSIPLSVIAFLSSFIGTLTAQIGGADKKLIAQGLFGFNSALSGLAMSIFLAEDNRWLIALFSAIIASIFTAAIMHITKPFDVPSLTFPYIILAWFLLTTSHRLKFIEASDSLTPNVLAYFELDISGPVDLISAATKSFGQIYFADHIWGGLLILLGIFFASRRLGVLAIISMVISLLTAYYLGSSHSLINSGLYGYNAILTIFAVSDVFSDRKKWIPVSGLIASIVSVLLTASLDSFLLPYGLPALTMPFVLSTWLFLFARKVMPSL
ncbi:urea transporter [Sporosarcina sp. P13]|uniref:urea transporter n=1 Tax=Sporosarcina sp. P13 TaxID=2048263 RepID=UPI000C16C361|nr:urea transporter [Sporosarcina sp. P13]PIC63933.1 urea transporter [Sporosarcina sp. P13]